MLVDFSAPAYGKSATPVLNTFPPVADGTSVRLLTDEPLIDYTRQGHWPTATATTDLMDSPMDWSWEQLRDYVVRSVEERHGPQARDIIKETAIFKSFAARWGNQAGPIARFAFEQQDGFWRSAPVTVGRFTKGSDAYFAGPISERLAHV